jgi:hypothetical protein
VTLGTVLLAGENRGKNVGASSKRFGKTKTKGIFCWRVLKHGPHSPTNILSTQSSQTLGHVRRLCCTMFPKLPVRHRRFLVLLPLPPPLYAAHPLTPSPPCFRYERCPPRSRPCALHVEPTPVPSLGVARAVTTAHPAPACTRSHPGPAPARRTSCQNL